MRPIGAAVHLRRGTVNRGLVGWMVLGSVPMAFLGAYLLHLMGHAKTAQQQHRDRPRRGAAPRRRGDGAALRARPPRRTHAHRAASSTSTPRPLPTVAIGMVGGVIVGLTSVGSGSLMIVLLLFLYPMLGASQLVGTDLTQAVPLTLAAALGALAFGHVELGVTVSLVLGSVPAVLVGALVSSSAPDRYVRPVITFVIFASGLKYVGLGTTALGWVLCAVLLGAGGAWLLAAAAPPAAPTPPSRRRRRASAGPQPRSAASRADSTASKRRHDVGAVRRLGDRPARGPDPQRLLDQHLALGGRRRVLHHLGERVELADHHRRHAARRLADLLVGALDDPPVADRG